MSWLLNTKKQFKIWFSPNKEEFLPAENKLRFIRTILANPSTSFSFVFSSKILSTQAVSELMLFCHRLNIIPIDIDHLIYTKLTNDIDKTIFQITTSEIKQAISKQGGNAAAASDCLRTLPLLIETAGIYSDFDVELNF